MDLKQIKNILWTINVYDKWTYSFKTHEVIGYTCFLWDENDNQFFKPKTWCKCDFHTFLKIFKKAKYRENFFLP